jgi:protein arginine N-methyltransferase 1
MIFPDKATMCIAAIEDGDYKEEKIGFWENVYGFDYSSLKDIVIKEPLVDIVESRSVVSNICEFKEIDILTVTKEELTFKAPFKITAERDDYAHAFISWFDIAFTHCHKPVTFSTGPFAKYTHWKQTVFYTKEALTLKKGETIEGELTCAPNKSNPRDLDIIIDYTFNGEKEKVKEVCEYKMS